MALSYNLGYQESISVHPTRRQNFDGKPYSNFPNIWEWLIYSWGTAPILYYLGTPLMPYNWGTPPTPHPIYFIASGPREMGQTRAGGIDPSVRTSCDHLCISCKLVSPILPESITITLFCILFRSPANPHHILVHCGISEKSPLILFLCHYWHCCSSSTFWFIFLSHKKLLFTQFVRLSAH